MTQPLPPGDDAGQSPWAIPPQPAEPGQWPAAPQPGQWSAPPPQPPASPGQWDYLGGVQPAPAGLETPPHRRKGPLLIAAGAAAVLVGGGTATYVAVSDSGGGGASSPQAAVTSIIADLNKSDLFGALDHLAPGERDVLLNPVKDAINTQKRLHVIKPDANFTKLSGAQFTAQHLTFGSATETINDHVQIVKLTGGTISVNSDLSKYPFTDEFLKVAFPHGLPAGSAQSVDIPQAVQDNGEPIRLAAQKVSGKWYPSILYTIADNATHQNHQNNPGPADYVAPNGADSPQDAVKQLVEAASQSDFHRLIELTAPDETAALHDYAGLLLDQAPAAQTALFTVKNMDLATASTAGGTRVTLESVTVDSGGDEAQFAIDGSCVQVTSQGQTQKYCAADAVTQVEQAIGKTLTADQRTAFEHLFSGLANVGIDTTQSGGKWYVNPVRSFFDLSNALVSGLQGNDLLTLLALIPQ